VIYHLHQQRLVEDCRFIEQVMSKPALHSEEGKDGVVVVCVCLWYMCVHYMLIDPKSRTPESAGCVLTVLTSTSP
jgi:hypothetical protein